MNASATPALWTVRPMTASAALGRRLWLATWGLDPAVVLQRFGVTVWPRLSATTQRAADVRFSVLPLVAERPVPRPGRLFG